MFRKILIANRGEIACRVAATARRMGIRTVAVYSTADAAAQHVAACDEAVWIGEAPPAQSYLQWERILAAAKATGAQAVHPGYGFLSENEGFAQACADAGVVFIGPPPRAIKAMGLKAESKRLMAAAGVPLVPGYHGTDQNPALLADEAQRIGYPVLIKASAGGGGKGMRIVRSAHEFADALASCQREARNSFGDDAVLIERYAQRPRHIEIQVFADTQGNVIHLFERDCSVQRRHQKVLEEAPAPGLSEEVRHVMTRAAIDAARAVGYVGAGTVEFIVEQHDDGRMLPYFMEMNTRLQVEHPVTEAVTALDLVEWQLRIAAGQALPLKQEQVCLQGHAIEARVCAENPFEQFLPATGALQRYVKPPHSAFTPSRVRIDDGVAQGDVITPHYDSMIAKVIVHGADREEARARLRATLAQMQVRGLPNNVSFLMQVLDSTSFVRADLDTALIEREREDVLTERHLGLRETLAAVVAARWLAPENMPHPDPWAWSDGWSSHGNSEQTIRFTARGHEGRATVCRQRDGAWSLTLDAERCVLQARRTERGVSVRLGERSFVAQVLALEADAWHVQTSDGSATLTWHSEHQGAAAQDAPGQMKSPMPGRLIWLGVKPGDRVEKGQALFILEAMKMEHTIHAAVAGVVKQAPYSVGDQVDEGVELVMLEVQ